MILYIQNIISGAGNIAGFITLSATVLGAVSLFLSNLARYRLGNKLGIPVKAMHQASIGDSVGIWITLLGGLGFGLFIPILVLDADMLWWVAVIIAFISFYCAQSMIRSYRRMRERYEEKNGARILTYRDITWHNYLIVALIGAFSYAQVKDMYRQVFVNGFGFLEYTSGFWMNVRFYAAAIGLTACIYVVLSMLVYSIKTKLTGGREKMMTEIDGQTYLVAMRNSQYHWILVPCRFYSFRKQAIIGYNQFNYAEFVKGEFILCDMSDPPRKVTRIEGYQLIEKATILQETQEEEPVQNDCK
ncbi:MAG: hypothetical protein FWC95_06020 [Defluviitaleaceae bacterium]|nr:hypothetical protein [Defluviitaleaceae bacterium]